jgi:RHS repeat-associated protein
MRRSTPRHTPLTRLATATNSFGKRRSFIYAVDRTGSNTTRQSPYIYDVNNQRIAKTVDLDGQGANPATTTRFVYDRNNVALEFTGSATVPSTRYFHGTNVDQVLAQESNNTTTWLLSDQIGTTRDLVNNSGTLLNHFTYDSFGTQTGSTLGATVDTRYKFTGREFDGETGDYFYRSRYYDPEVGRFLGEDAIWFGGGDVNLYRYVENTPINAIDPSGMLIRVLPRPGTLTRPGTNLKPAPPTAPIAPGQNPLQPLPFRLPIPEPLPFPEPQPTPQPSPGPNPSSCKKRDVCDGAIQGGSYDAVRNSNAGSKGQAHHMPSWAATRDSDLLLGKVQNAKGITPAICMIPEDHRKTLSYGGSNTNYKPIQINYINNNEYYLAQVMDIFNVKQIAFRNHGRGDFYDKAIIEMRNYTINLQRQQPELFALPQRFEA